MYTWDHLKTQSCHPEARSVFNSTGKVKYLYVWFQFKQQFLTWAETYSWKSVLFSCPLLGLLLRCWKPSKIFSGSYFCQSGELSVGKIFAGKKGRSQPGKKKVAMLEGKEKTPLECLFSSFKTPAFTWIRSPFYIRNWRKLTTDDFNMGCF